MSLSNERASILTLASCLRPTLLEARWAELERMGLPAGKTYGDVVSGTRPLQIPVDKEGDLKDLLDKRIRGARKAVTDAYDEALTALQRAFAIQEAWLVPVHIADKDERALASDLGVDCLACARPVACTPVDPIREGFCEACSKRFRRQGKPDRVKFIRDTRLAQDVSEVVEA